MANDGTPEGNPARTVEARISPGGVLGASWTLVVLLAAGGIATPGAPPPECYVPADGSYACVTEEFQHQGLSEQATQVFLDDDELYGPVPLGFGFWFYNRFHEEVWISSNGFVTFDPLSGHGCCRGDPVPTDLPPNDLVACLWEDLNPKQGGTIHHETLTSGPSGEHVFVVQFNDVPYYFNTGVNTFQVILKERLSFPPDPAERNADAFCEYTRVGDDGDQVLAIAGTESPLEDPPRHVKGVRASGMELLDQTGSQSGLRFVGLPPEV